MRFIHKVIPAILSATLLVSATGGAAFADNTPPQPATVRCVDGVCTVRAPLTGLSPLARFGATLGIAALQGKPDALPAGARLAIDDDLVLTVPLGQITLPQAQLDVEMGDDSQIARLRGSVETPIPTLGVLSDVRMVQPARAEVGLDTGANLSHLGAPLVADRQYLFFNIASGMDAAGVIEGTGETLRLSTPAGQALTLIIDTEEPLVYLAGNLTVNTSGEMLLAGPLQALAEQSPLIPDALPLRQRTQVVISGLAGKNAEEQLTLGGSWSVGAGALGRWIGVEAMPLAVEGLVTLGADGLLVDGVVRSAIAPDKVLDGQAQVTAFIPFKRGGEAAFVETKAAVAIPLAGVDVDGSARLDLPRSETVAANVIAPLAGKASEAWQTVRTTASQQAASGAQAAQDLAARGGAWLSTLPALDLGSNLRLPPVLVQR